MIFSHDIQRQLALSSKAESGLVVEISFQRQNKFRETF